MKRSILLCTIVLLASFFTMQSFAKTVKIKRYAMSSTELPSIYLPGKAPAGTFQVYGGLRTVAKGQQVYLKADTTGTITAITWSFLEKPTGSTVAFTTVNDTNKANTSGKRTAFTPDLTGRYIIQVDADGTKDQDTFFVSTYLGTFVARTINDQGDVAVSCGACHKDKYDNWKTTGHAMHFKWGVSGNLEAEGGRGSYGPGCVKCHTTGWDQTLDNGNFGYLAKQSGFDTLWYKGKDFTKSGTSYLITSGSTYAWSLMQKMDSSSVNKLEPLASIGCEWCHGPGKDHNGNKAKISKSFEAGLCEQCHDAMTHHRLGHYYNASAHAKWPDGEHTAQTGCFPCHSGLAFKKWLDAGRPAQMTTTNIYSTKGVDEGDVPLTCAACHDPHGNGNPNQLRTMTTIPLRNGFVVNGGGKGAICMNCHNSRYDANKKVTDTAPLYGFAAHYGPHGNPQADMYFGQNAYQFGQKFDNYTTHAFMDDACATCHMQERTEEGATIANHEWTMTTADGKDRVEICQRCHGSSVEEFNDIKGQDYDGNGKVEGVKTEIANMMAQLKALLPQKNGDVIANVADTAGIKLSKQIVGALYDYLYVKNDGSGGMHNAKYTVAILRAAINSFSVNGVATKNNDVPKSYNLSQNFPNPFNPTTQIEFSVPNAARVKLNVYNIVGQLVATLVNGEMVPGNYTATWNGRDLSGSMAASGIYLYRIEGVGQNGQNFTLTKKMVLTK